jgi:hypothetical protein
MPTFLATQQALSRHLFWAHELGLDLTPEVLLSERHINAFVATGLGSVSIRTRKAYRTGLRRVARGTLRKPPRERKYPTWNHRGIAPPYTRDDLADIDAAVAVQTTQLRARFFDSWVCLCAGAGVRNTELRYISAADITEDDGMLLVHVRPPRERTVPLRREYNDRVRVLMAAHPDQPLAGPFRRSDEALGAATYRVWATDTCADDPAGTSTTSLATKLPRGSTAPTSNEVEFNAAATTSNNDGTELAGTGHTGPG